MKVISVAKAALYGIFLHYYCYYTLTGSFIPGGTMIFFAIAAFCVGLDMINKRYVYVGNEIKCWILYAILSFITTGFITLNSDGIGYIWDIAKFVQRLMIIIMVAYICESEKSVRFGLRLMAVTAVACAVSILMVVDDIQLKLSISTGANLSENDVGAIMAFGAFAIMFFIGQRNKSSLLLTGLKTTGIIAVLTVIFLTGSRKSFGAVAILFILMIFLWITDYRKNYNPYRLIIVLIVGVAAYLFVSKYLLPYAEQTNLYTRLLGRGAERASESDQGRINLYIWALQDFASHPLFGLGFAQFTHHHGNYTHSTYVEPLACSGLIGILYLYPYYSIVKKQIYLIRKNKKGSYARLKQKEILVYLIIFLFVAVGIPYMYKDIPCILLGTFIASQAISFDELRTMDCTSTGY